MNKPTKKDELTDLPLDNPIRRFNAGYNWCWHEFNEWHEEAFKALQEEIHRLRDQLKSLKEKP